MASRNQLKERYEQLNERIVAAAERSGRSAAEIITVAVTKQASPSQIRQLVEMGHVDLGESRVQQLQQRVATLEEFVSRHHMLSGDKPTAMPEKVRWHMIGHLQRNKVKAVLPLVKLVHSVDSLRLAEEIQTQAAKMDREVEVLLQVNTAGESQKFGLAPPAVPHVVEQIMTMLHVKVRGLMVMAPQSDDPEDARAVFTRTAELFNDMKIEGRFGRDFNILSMGMSDDFEVAIECGANVLRIGRALFGEPVPASQ